MLGGTVCFHTSGGSVAELRSFVTTAKQKGGFGELAQCRTELQKSHRGDEGGLPHRTPLPSCWREEKLLEKKRVHVGWRSTVNLVIDQDLPTDELLGASNMCLRAKFRNVEKAK